MPRLDAAVVTPLTPADGAGAGAAVGEGRQAAFQRALQGMVGQTVTAEVISSVKDGSFIVRVADNAVRMMLPPGTQVGADIPLTVLSANPRPTFQLANAPAGGNPTVLYADGEAAAAPLPSQGSAVYVPGRTPPAAPGQTGQAGAPASPAANPAATPGADGGTVADADPALPGQLKPGAAPNNAAPPAGARPGAGAGEAAPAGQPGRPAPAAQPGAAAPANGAANPAALPATAGQPAANAAANPAATAANAATAAGAAGSAVPADAVKPQSLAATLLGKAPLTPAAELPDLDPSTPAPTLSSTARALTTVLGAVQTGQAAQLALIGKTALFGNAAPDTAELAQKLQNSISQSGLFYESHVTQWVKGERTLPELMREPQMQRLAQGGDNAARAAANGPDLSAAQMINQQLHTQEQGRVQWQGQAWPGQPMQWEIRREQRDGRKDEGGADAEPEQVWRSGVRFRFPALGTVSASVTLIGGQVHIQVQTGSDDTAVTLRAYAGALEAAMEAAGAPLSSLSIAQGDRDDG
ncbi:flagellar hook-length control protein FliK [Duganella sp. SAP-35]|uniref:Flagellar hook-length control protein FliK n=1 Tax=Duganella aceris TaxID=2703883 RepID=A0ABX0FIF5_9BURK|nr:flagellar hook-length control protein FliK [Duganella aceris]